MIPDINVIVAASRSDHVHHTATTAWLDGVMVARAGNGTIEILPVVAAGFLRIVTNARVFVDPTPIDRAVAFIDALLSSQSAEMPDTGREWPALRQLCREQGLTGNDIPDAWIAATVKSLRGHLVTFDRGFRRLLGRGELTVLLPGERRLN